MLWKREPPFCRELPDKAIIADESLANPSSQPHRRSPYQRLTGMGCGRQVRFDRPNLGLMLGCVGTAMASRFSPDLEPCYYTSYVLWTNQQYGYDSQTDR